LDLKREQASSNNPSAAPIIAYTRMTWRDYLKESEVQTIEGDEFEVRRSKEQLAKMEIYFRRYDVIFVLFVYC
jgi:predicted transcriptional regulator YdeE